MELGAEFKKYTFAKEVPGTLWGTNIEETPTYLWPDDDDAIRAILSPSLQQGPAEKTAAIAQARAKLSEFGKDDPDEVHAIIKTIMQVPPSRP